MNHFLDQIVHGRVTQAFLLGLVMATSFCFVQVSGATSASTSPTLTTSCSSLTTNNRVFFSGGSGTILFNCNGRAALTVARAGKFEPFFALPPGFASLTIAPHTPGAMTCVRGLALTSGAMFAFVRPGNFDYCALYSNYPASGIPSFSLTWTK